MRLPQLLQRKPKLSACFPQAAQQKETSEPKLRAPGEVENRNAGLGRLRGPHVRSAARAGCLQQAHTFSVILERRHSGYNSLD
mmetsp:Transcript_59046/g.95496  ORF Transcript_59046/g.95496 Transcript_59046/m.95496 type:complete len:83 (-) Transcript_59046:14-262(-)